MKRVVSTLVTLIVLMGLLSACAAPAQAPAPANTEAPKVAEPAAAEPAKKLKVGFTLPTLQFPFYVRMHDTFMAEAAKRGWDVVYVDGNLDSLTQVNASLDLLSKGIDVLVMATWWIDAMPDVLNTAAKAGIPVFLMDITMAAVPEGSKSQVTAAAGTLNYDAGMVGGEWMAKRLAAEGKKSVNLILVSMPSETANDRCQGFVDGIKKAGIEVNVLNEYIGDTRANGMRTTEDALVTYPEGKLDLIYGYSAQSSLGAYDAVMAANRKEIQVVGFDGEDDEKKLIDAGTQYIGTIMQFPDQMSVTIAALVEKNVVNGETIEQNNLVPAGVYEKK